jgi:hypothetical protein
MTKLRGRVSIRPESEYSFEINEEVKSEVSSEENGII